MDQKLAVLFMPDDMTLTKEKTQCPVPIAYMEIGFYDSSDLSILQSSSDEIGKAIAEGVDEYLKNN